MSNLTLFHSEVKCEGEAVDEITVLRMMYIDHTYLLLGHSNKLAEGYDSDDSDPKLDDETVFLYCYKKGGIISKYRLHDRIIFLSKNITN